MPHSDSEHWCRRLYEEKAAQLILYGRALGLSHCEAEDVLQETFLSLVKSRETPENPAHYCIRSFRNRALNYRRGFWRRLARELESRQWFEQSPDSLPFESEAMRCLAGLPSEQREVVVLRIWHTYTFQEIAQLLEIPANTVAGRYRYGLKKMKICMKGDQYERLESLGNSFGFVEAAPSLART